MKRILVTRFSAMGDVAMVASVLKELLNQHKDVEVVMVSRPFFKAFFQDIPRVIFHPIDPNGKHKGVRGLIRLYKELKNYKTFEVADLHNNLRSRFLDNLFRWSGCRVMILDKGRKEKKALTRSKKKILKPLKPTTERYADVFRKLGLSMTLPHALQKKLREFPENLRPLLKEKGPLIGISAFAQHPYKVLPLETMGAVIQGLSSLGATVFLFGGGEKEKQITENWAQAIPNVFSLVSKLSLKEELDVISHLDLMISMDSSGMHMASLVGTRCISIWGATHPYAGFLGYGQSIDDCIQVDHPNRPSSIYGNKSCICDGMEAIELVNSEMVLDKVKGVLEQEV